MADSDGPEGHLVKFPQKNLRSAKVPRPGHGQRLRAKVRPAGREIAAQGRLAGHIGLVFDIDMGHISHTVISPRGPCD